MLPLDTNSPSTTAPSLQPSPNQLTLIDKTVFTTKNPLPTIDSTAIEQI